MASLAGLSGEEGNPSRAAVRLKAISLSRRQLKAASGGAVNADTNSGFISALFYSREQLLQVRMRCKEHARRLPCLRQRASLAVVQFLLRGRSVHEFGPSPAKRTVFSAFVAGGFAFRSPRGAYALIPLFHLDKQLEIVS